MSRPAPLIPVDAPPSYEVASTNNTTTNNTSTSPAPPRRVALARPPPLELPALNALRNKRVILASASPRRRQLLAQIGLTGIEVIPSKFEENLPKTVSPFQYVLDTATQKALAVYKQEINNEAAGEPGLILAADTVVVSSNGDILEKPRSEVMHIQMLQQLRDTGAHRVYTAVAAMVPLASARDPGYALEVVTEETLVKFDSEVTDELLLAYVKTREGADKAGGYGIQGTGAILVEKIEGSFDNVVGLPLRATLKLIEKAIAKADDEDLLVDEDALAADEADQQEEEDPGMDLSRFNRA